MKKVKRTVLILVVILVLISGAVTVYAVSADAGKTPVSPVADDYTAEEMAVENYYEGQVLETLGAEC